jgi:hypothetical protein
LIHATPTTGDEIEALERSESRLNRIWIPKSAVL